MRADSSGARGTGLLLALALLSNACVSLTPPPGPGRSLRPQGVRDALGDAPEVRAMRMTGKTGAGMAEPPRHHVMPKEFREWFEKRGFTGKNMSIEWFCVTLQQPHHQAIHGGGNWKLGRQWRGEWNQMIMKALRDAEVEAGQILTRNEILEFVAERMGFYGIPMNFVRCRGK
jgi:hypothetical protein